MDSYNKDMDLQDQGFIQNLRKDELALMAEGHEQSHSRFDVDEHLEVQLRFDLGSFVDAHMLLDTNGPRDSHWDFIRQEQSGITFQASSEENVALLAHRVKQDDVKPFDNCEGWPRSSSSQVDSHLFLDTQDDVSMITDAFGAKSRTIEAATECEGGPRLISYGHDDEATAWVDLSEREHLQARDDGNEVSDDNTCKGNDVHSQLNKKKAVSSKTKPESDVVGCKGSQTLKQHDSPTMENTTDQTLREGELIISANMLEPPNEAVQTVHKQLADESSKLDPDFRIETILNTKQTKGKERPDACGFPDESRPPDLQDNTQVVESSQGPVVECIKVTTAQVDKMRSPANPKVVNFQREDDEIEAEASTHCEGKDLFQDQACTNMVTDGQFLGSVRQMEDAHDSTGENQSALCIPSALTSQSPMSTAVPIHCILDMSSQHDNEGKPDNVENKQAGGGQEANKVMIKVSSQIVPPVDQELQEDKAMLDESIAQIQLKVDQVVNETNAKAQVLELVSESVEKNTAIDTLEPAAFASEKVRKHESLVGLPDAGSLIPENQRTSNYLESSHEEEHMSSLNVCSIVESIGKLSQVEKHDESKSAEQSRVAAELSMIPPCHQEVVPSISDGHIVSDTSDVQEGASPTKEQSVDKVLAEMDLRSQVSQSDRQLRSTDSLNEAEKITDPDMLPSQIDVRSQNSHSDCQVLPTDGLNDAERISDPGTVPLESGVKMEYASHSGPVQSVSEDVTITKQNETVMTAEPIDNGVSDVLIPMSEENSTHVEKRAPASEPMECLARQGAVDLFVGDAVEKESTECTVRQVAADVFVGDADEKSENTREHGEMEQGVRVEVSAVDTSGLNMTSFSAGQAPHVVGKLSSAENEQSSRAVNMDVAEGLNDPGECIGAQGVATNIECSRIVDVAMEDVPEAELEMKSADKQQEPLTEVSSQLSTDHKSDDEFLELTSVDTKIQARESPKAAVTLAQEGREPCFNKVASAGAEEDAFEGVEGKLNEKQINIPLDECTRQLESEETINDGLHLEASVEDKQSSPVASKKIHGGSNADSTGSASKPGILDNSGIPIIQTENTQSCEGIQLLVEVSCTEAELGHDDRQVSDALEGGPHLEKQDDCLTKELVFKGGVSPQNAVHNEAVQEQKIKSQPKESEIKSVAGRIKSDITAAELQVDTAPAVSMASISIAVAVGTPESSTPEPNENLKSEVVSLKVGSDLRNDGQSESSADQNEDLGAKVQRQEQVSSGQADFQGLQKPSREGVQLPNSKAAAFSQADTKVSSRNRVCESVEGTIEVGSVLPESIVESQSAEKSGQYVEVTKDSPALSGPSRTVGKSSLVHHEASFGNKVPEGREMPSLSRETSVTVLETVQLPPNMNKPTLALNSRQQMALPDLNVAEIIPAPLPVQPFSESQQVQLRAQILVYGSLIQGALPEEPLMIASFSDITGAARKEAGKDSSGGRGLWEKSWQTAAERVKNRGWLSTPRDPAHGVGISLPVVPSVSSARTAEEGTRFTGISANLGAGAANSVVDARNSPVLNARFPDSSGSKGHSSRARQSTEAGTSKSGSKSNQPVIMNSARPSATSNAMRPLPSLLGECFTNAQSTRPMHVEVQQLPPRAFYPTPHLGPSLPGSTHWISSSPFPGPWIPQSQQAGFESSVPFTHTQSAVSSDMIQDPAGTRRNTSSGRPFVPVMPIVPPFSASAIGSSPILTGADAGAVQKNNAGSIRTPASESRPRKRKKSQAEPLSILPDMLAAASFSLSRAVSVPGGGSGTTAALSVSLSRSETHQTIPVTSSLSNAPLFSSAESLAIVVASNQHSSTVVGSSMPAQPARHASVPFSTNILSAHPSNPTTERQLVPAGESREYARLAQNVIHVEEAKASAEEASSIAASAVRESESVWSQLQAQGSSGIVSERETQLIASAMAMATAASVAKAAAAAARVAYEAALQAKVMREEASESSEQANGGPSSEKLSWRTALPEESGNDKARLWRMPNSYKSIMETAKTASKKKLEDASAARMKAHNLYSVVRAAELASAAVSQVGAVVAMGDSVPFTLDMLLEAGPEGFHRLVSPGLLQEEKAYQIGNELKTLGKSPLMGKDLEASDKSLLQKEDSVVKEISMQEAHMASQSTEVDAEVALGLLKNHQFEGSGHIDNVASAHKEAGTNETSEKDTGVSKNGDLLSTEAEGDIRTEQGAQAPANQIAKDSIVEVLSDEEGLRGVWFSARVLNVEGGKALVLYDELLSDDGPDPLEEWIDLEGAPGEAPRLRVAHPNSNISFEGTRKRRREAMGNHKWAIGDRVDAWIRDGWWEGEILDVSEESESKVKVFFPGEGDTVLIKTSKLRPSLVWRNSQWVLWTDIKEQNYRPVESSIDVHKGESPAAKRQKTEKDQSVMSNVFKQKVIEASTGEKVPVLRQMEEDNRGNAVNLQKDGRDSATDKMARDISAKQASKVVFGVPKPTKRRKFIEVSKHYASNRVTRGSPDGKVPGRHEGHKESTLGFHMGSALPVKYEGAKAKKKIPSMQPVRERKEPEKVETVQTKTMLTKSQREKPSPGFGMGVRKDAHSREVLESGPKGREVKLAKKNTVPVGDTQRQTGNSAGMLPKETTVRNLQATVKQAVIPMSSDRVGNEKQPPTSIREHGKDKDLGKSGTEILVQRRSNRTIQPTSKLLEGLQSTPKLGKSGLSLSHDKGSKQPVKIVASTEKGFMSPLKH